MTLRIASYVFLTWWSGYPLCGKYVLIKVIGCLLTDIDAAMTRSLTHSTQLTLFLHLLFTMIATPCLFTKLPDSTTTCPCSDSHISLFGLHVSETTVTSNFAPYTSRNNSSNLSLELIDLLFSFCRTVNATSLGSVSSSFECKPVLLLLFLVTTSSILFFASPVVARCLFFSLLLYL